MASEITYTDEELVARLRFGSHMERKAAERLNGLVEARELVAQFTGPPYISSDCLAEMLIDILGDEQ